MHGWTTHTARHKNNQKTGKPRQCNKFIFHNISPLFHFYLSHYTFMLAYIQYNIYNNTKYYLKTEFLMIAVGLTHIGRVRNQNQDAYYSSIEAVGALPNLFIVADGMGGHKAGDVASKQAVERFVEQINETRTPMDSCVGLLAAIAHRVNDEVYNLAQSNSDMEGMGTTFIACVINKKRAEIIHVGDSRVYFITPEGIKQISQDHTYAEEMHRAGELSAEEARNHPKRHHLTRVLGFDPNVGLDGITRDITDVTSVLLCTDGLTNMLEDDVLAHICNLQISVKDRAEMLVERANLNGGTDNISLILIDLHGGKI
jgi:protein phosphatase